MYEDPCDEIGTCPLCGRRECTELNYHYDMDYLPDKDAVTSRSDFLCPKCGCKFIEVYFMGVSVRTLYVISEDDSGNEYETMYYEDVSKSRSEPSPLDLW